MVDRLIDFDILFLISFVITIALLFVIGYREIKYRFFSKKSESNNDSKNDNSNEEKLNGILLQDLRNSGYSGFEDLSVIDSTIFFIDEDEYEALGIFMSVAPDVLSTLVRLEKSVLYIDHLFDDKNSDKDDLNIRMGIVRNSLQTLVEASDQLLNKMYEIYSNSSINTVETQIDTDLIKGYLQTATEFVGFAFDYLHINNEVHQKLMQRDPHLEEGFLDVTNKFLHIFFADLMNCISMLDESIVIYK